MLVISFAIWYEMIQATVRAGAFVRAIEEHALRAQYRFRTRLSRAWRWSEAGARLKRLRFDVIAKTFCDWINKTEVAVMSGVANPRLRPCVNGVK